MAVAEMTPPQTSSRKPANFMEMDLTYHTSRLFRLA